MQSKHPAAERPHRTFDDIGERSGKSAEAMKRAAKRMKKNAPELLGVELTLTQCQAMVARMAGFASFNDAMKYLTKPVNAAGN